MKKSLLFFIILMIFNTLNAQNYDNLTLPSSLRNSSKASTTKAANSRTDADLFAGGYLSYNLHTSLSLTPYFGIYATKWLRFGVGPRYELTWNYYTNSAAHSFGATAFAQAIIARCLILHAGYEYLSYPNFTEMASGMYQYDGRANIHALAVGVGFKTHLSNIVSLSGMYLLYPIESENTFYNHQFLDMFVRFGVDVDLFVPKK